MLAVLVIQRQAGLFFRVSSPAETWATRDQKAALGHRWWYSHACRDFEMLRWCHCGRWPLALWVGMNLAILILYPKIPTHPYLKNSGLMFDIRGSIYFSTAGLTIFYFLVWLSGLALILRSLLPISFSSNQLILAPASFSVKIVLLQFPALLWFGFSTSCSLGTSIFTSFDLSDGTVLVVAIVQQSEVILICQSNIFLS